MRKPSFLLRPWLLWLLLLLPPLPSTSSQILPTTAPSGPSGAPACPEACTCAQGGLANCSARSLPAVPAGLSRRVRALLLDHNRVCTLPPGAFAGADALLRLDLRENGLRTVHARAFWGLCALHWLDLGSNHLEVLAPGTLAPLRALRVLSLAGNRLARLEPAALGTLPLLRALSLQDNALVALGPGVLAALPALDSLHLRGNPWACGCSLRPLCGWLRRHPHPTDAETVLCSFPGRLALSPLTAFTDAAFSHCAQPLTLRDLAVVYVLGPFSFLASLAACLVLGVNKGHRQKSGDIPLGNTTAHAGHGPGGRQGQRLRSGEAAAKTREGWARTGRWAGHTPERGACGRAGPRGGARRAGCPGLWRGLGLLESEDENRRREEPESALRLRLARNPDREDKDGEGQGEPAGARGEGVGVGCSKKGGAQALEDRVAQPAGWWVRLWLHSSLCTQCQRGPSPALEPRALPLRSALRPCPAGSATGPCSPLGPSRAAGPPVSLAG
ncbi:PREDICTED: leucine-rich repeat-containing protein 26 [Elephantulus edwardii]|uniref:leucine-rich repeat-containing protein 26 n=1 Tax=Elephantulus edwardii TaxID=28737 RepID=UPI0003F0A491|nr:PREDICTED: leucine-rich repeat-containing protein 26 [Elephantulus edwardii]